jgi:hypothetical protein
MVHIRKLQALADIRSHLQLHGSRNWGSLRMRYDDVPPATWWRWIRREKTRLGTQNLASAGQQKLTAHATNDAYCAVRGEGAATMAAGVLPGAHVDFLAAFRGLFADATRLRNHALHIDGRLRDPAVLDRSIKIRLKLIKQGLELERQIYSANAQRAFYAALVEEIVAESPEVQRRMIERLRTFDREFKSDPTIGP